VGIVRGTLAVAFGERLAAVKPQLRLSHRLLLAGNEKGPGRTGAF
jgi:hypothetical protein